jgi:hypothetical protein
MLLMTCRAGAVLNDVRLVQRVLHVTRLTFLIDGRKGDAFAKSIAYHLFEFHECERTARHQGFVVTARTVVAESGMVGGNSTNVEKRFTATHLKNGDANDSADDGQNADQGACPPPRMQPTVIAEIAFVALGDLFLRASWVCHRRGLNQWRAELCDAGHPGRATRNDAADMAAATGTLGGIGRLCSSDRINNRRA